tara:strand:- start:378 stop:3401 length:3024 start_codon:yes stop_codon:yes gene_type:complete
MTNYRKSMMESLAEVRGLQEDNMDMMRKAAGGDMQTIKMKDGKLQMDSFTASAIMQVYDKINPANQKKMAKMINDGKKSGIMKLQDFAMKQIKFEYEPQEEQLAKIKGNTPADKGRLAATQDDIDRAEKKGDKKLVKKLKEDDLDEAIKDYEVKIKVGSKTNSYTIPAKDELSAAQSVLHSVIARSKTGGSPGLAAIRKQYPDMKSLKKKGISVSIKEEVGLDEDIMPLIFGGGVIAGLLPILYLSAKEIAGPSIGKLVDKLKKNKNYKMSDSEKSDVKGFVSKVKKDKPSLLQKAMKKIKEEVELDEGREKDARQLVNPNKEVMVVKKNRVVVIDKKDQDKYLKQGWELAEEVDLDEEIKVGSKVTLPKGVGFWDTTSYPIGGKFDRVTDAKGLEVTVLRTFKPSNQTKMTNTEGETADNRKIAFKSSLIEEVELGEWTVSDVEIAMKKKYGKIDKEAIEKLKKVQYMGNVDRNDLVKVGHGKLHVESVELDEKVQFEAPTKDGNTFQVIDRDTKGMRGPQDKFKMVVVDKKGKVVKDWGSHPSLEGAKKFGKNRKIIEEVELDEGKMKDAILKAYSPDLLAHAADMIDDGASDREIMKATKLSAKEVKKIRLSYSDRPGEYDEEIAQHHAKNIEEIEEEIAELDTLIEELDEGILGNVAKAAGKTIAKGAKEAGKAAVGKVKKKVGGSKIGRAYGKAKAGYKKAKSIGGKIKKAVKTGQAYGDEYDPMLEKLEIIESKLNDYCKILEEVVEDDETFKEYFEIGTDKYRDHCEKVTPGEGLDEANYEIKNGKIHISKANFRKVHKDYKNSTKGKERMMALDPKSGATTSYEVVFEAVDPADVDDDATDDDRAAASKNIIHQLRKSIDQDGRFVVTFGDNKKVKVDAKIAKAINDKFMSIKRPPDKEKFQSQIAKSYKDMLKVLKNGFNEEIQKETILDRIDKKLKERKELHEASNRWELGGKKFSLVNDKGTWILVTQGTGTEKKLKARTQQQATAELVKKGYRES